MPTVLENLDRHAFGPREGAVTRRSFVAALSLAAVAVGTGWTGARAQDEFTAALATPYRADAALNLREGPGTSFRVLTVVPAGGYVTGSSDVSNGYRKVSYQGVLGWVVSGGLSITNGGSMDFGPVVGTGKTTSDLNLRTGPTLIHDVVLVIPAGATINLYDRTQDGFRGVGYGGKVGWSSAAYITTGGTTPPPPPTGTAKTTTDLNLRASASTSAKILLVMPAGATVTLGAQSSNGFRQVTYNGVSGWAFAEYLSTSGGGQQPGTAKTTTSLNLRAQPSTSAKILLVMPAGATVSVTDELSNGFRKVAYNGTTGWAFNEYLA